MSETKTWTCPNCPNHPEFEHSAMMDHLRSVHEIEPKTTKGRRTLLMHARTTTGSIYNWEWTIGDLTFLQSCVSDRESSAGASPSPGGEGRGEGVPSAIPHSSLPTRHLRGNPPPGTLGDADPMPFGKYKGKTMQSIPAGYLDWLRYQDWIIKWPKVMNYIEWRKGALDWELERKEREK